MLGCLTDGLPCTLDGLTDGLSCTLDGLTGMLGALLYGRLAQGAEQAADRAGDSPAQGPEAGRGLPLHVVYPGGLRGRGERPRREALVSIGLGASARNAPMSRLGHLPARA